MTKTNLIHLASAIICLWLSYIAMVKPNFRERIEIHSTVVVVAIEVPDSFSEPPVTENKACLVHHEQEQQLEELPNRDNAVSDSKPTIAPYAIDTTLSNGTIIELRQQYDNVVYLEEVSRSFAKNLIEAKTAFYTKKALKYKNRFGAMYSAIAKSSELNSDITLNCVIALYEDSGKINVELCMLNEAFDQFAVIELGHSMASEGFLLIEHHLTLAPGESKQWLERFIENNASLIPVFIPFDTQADTEDTVVTD